MRFTILPLAVMAVSSLTANLAGQESFKSPTAATAQKEYEEAIIQVRKAYVAKLEQALKEARQAKNTEEAIRIAKVRNGITDLETPGNPDPVDLLRKKLEGTRWGPELSQALSLRARKEVVFANGALGTWTLPDEKTLILQSNKSGNISVWKFNS